MRLYAGERVEGDDETMYERLAHAALIRDRDIRAAPRPAARGRRGRQKRPRWLRRKEEAAG